MKPQFAISSINNIIYVHTNIFWVDNFEHYDILNCDSINKPNISIIIDLPIIIKNLSSEKIKFLWVKVLNKNIEITEE